MMSSFTTFISRATVLSLTDSSIVVKLNDGSSYAVSTLTEVRRHRNLTGQRTQYPLKLAFAMTIHRAQGQTLSRVHVNCAGLFQGGHLCVAISRVRHISDLTLENFSPRCLMPVSQVVMDFLKDGRIPITMVSVTHLRNVEDIAIHFKLS